MIAVELLLSIAANTVAHQGTAVVLSETATAIDLNSKAELIENLASKAKVITTEKQPNGRERWRNWVIRPMATWISAYDEVVEERRAKQALIEGNKSKF